VNEDISYRNSWITCLQIVHSCGFIRP
jgi:hypothetical protein